VDIDRHVEILRLRQLLLEADSRIRKLAPEIGAEATVQLLRELRQCMELVEKLVAE